MTCYLWWYTICENYFLWCEDEWWWRLLTGSFLEILRDILLDSYLVLLLLRSRCRCFSRLWCLSCRLFLCFLCLWLSYLFWYFLGIRLSSSSSSSSIGLAELADSPLSLIGLLIGLNCISLCPDISALDECEAAEPPPGERLCRLRLWREDGSRLEDRKRFFVFLVGERSNLSPFLSNSLLEKTKAYKARWWQDSSYLFRWMGDFNSLPLCDDFFSSDTTTDGESLFGEPVIRMVSNQL